MIVTGPMTVKDFIDKLSQLDPKLPLFLLSEDESVVLKGHSHRMFDVTAIEEKEFEPVRRPDGTAGLKFEKTPHAVRMAVVSLTADV